MRELCYLRITGEVGVQHLIATRTSFLRSQGSANGYIDR